MKTMTKRQKIAELRHQLDRCIQRGATECILLGLKSDSKKPVSATFDRLITQRMKELGY